jgi:NAD(P)H dehydrogenase (quinone)
VHITIILAHPDNKSFNYAIAHTAVAELKQNGHKVSLHDLYAEKFDPILPANETFKDASVPAEIDKHCREISNAEGIIIIHPNWWGQPPAILKGWVDRVMRPGIAYKFIDGDNGEGVPVGLLKAKAVCVFNTSNTTQEREEKVFGDPLELLWKNCIFDLCGVKTIHRETFSVIITSTSEQRQEWLVKVREIIQKYFPKDNFT